MTAPRGRLTLEMAWLDTLWLQVAGTVCNIACKHCFISCGPKVETHRLMPVEEVAAALEEARILGVREVWFTGGEPFVHPDILTLIDLALRQAPLGVLTNGMYIDDALASELAARFRGAPYNLEIRVSLDGCTEADNDRVRGRGVFQAATAGIARLAARGLEPIVAVSLLDDTHADRDGFVALLRELGVRRPRVKWIPPFRIGREERRRGGRRYDPDERLSAEEVALPDAARRLMCGTSRCVTSEGVFPCPILINEPSFRLADRLQGALGPNPVDHEACHTCWAESFSCSA